MTHRARILPVLALMGLVSGFVLLGCGRESGAPARVGAAEFATHGVGEAVDGAEAQGSQGAYDAHAAHARGEPLGASTDLSLYHLGAAWSDQHGVERQLSSLAGRVQVVTMVYTTCGYACPRILGDMKRIEAGLPPEAQGRVGFVMISIDPARDTPERLWEYAEAVRLDSARWTLLTAPDNTVLELATLLGVKYRRISETDFSHSNVITVLDQRGEIAHRQVGLGEEPGGTLKVIERLLRAGG